MFRRLWQFLGFTYEPFPDHPFRVDELFDTMSTEAARVRSHFPSYSTGIPVSPKAPTLMTRVEVLAFAEAIMDRCAFEDCVGSMEARGLGNKRDSEALAEFALNLYFDSVLSAKQFELQSALALLKSSQYLVVASHTMDIQMAPLLDQLVYVGGMEAKTDYESSSNVPILVLEKTKMFLVNLFMFALCDSAEESAVANAKKSLTNVLASHYSRVHDKEAVLTDIYHLLWETYKDLAARREWLAQCTQSEDARAQCVQQIEKYIALVEFYQTEPRNRIS